MGEAIKKINFYTVCKYLFGITIYKYQNQILNELFYGSKNLITIRAPTRAGKSYLLAIAVLLYCIRYSNKKVGIIAPRFEQTRPIMNNIINLLNSNPDFESEVMISSEGLTKLERLRKEASKKRITFKNGTEIEIKTVDMAKRGEAILGFGYDLILVDESGLFTTEAYDKVFRMLLESPDTKLVEIGNPLYLNHFYENHNSDDFTKIHIHWKDCVEAGRFTTDQVELQRRKRGALYFRTMLEAEFPTQLEYSIFTETGILNSTEQISYAIEEYENISIGVDVAYGGLDNTVITLLGEKNNKFHYITNYTMNTNDTMTIVGKLRTIADNLPVNPIITIDTVGYGAGVFDRMKEFNYNVKRFVAGRRAYKKNLYFNLKSEMCFMLSEAMERNLLKNVPVNSLYTLEFKKILQEIKSDKTLKSIDPEDKSPDYFDSMLYAYSGLVKRNDVMLLEGLE